MNYLAHAFLSGEDENLIIGNFIADHIRGKEIHKYPPEIVKGIMMHRSIDAFTDCHADFRKAKRLFYEGFERHSGILVDIFFDHLLAKNFETYASLPLQHFSEQVYKVYSHHRPLLPASCGRFLDYVLQNHIYESYASEQGIERVLYHLSGRIKHGVRLDASMPLLNKNSEELQLLFTRFFTEVMKEFR